MVFSAPISKSRILVLGCTVILATAAPAQTPGRHVCRSETLARAAVDRGWAAYRINEIPAATTEFRKALELCPNDGQALTASGYTAMRSGDLIGAQNLFRRAVGAAPNSYDAVAGYGMAEYRAGRLEIAKKFFRRALRLVPGDSTALSYLEIISPTRMDMAASTRPRPETTSVISRAGRRVLEIHGADGSWIPLWVKAVNLGAALPGNFPSEFPPNDSTYERWIELISQSGANTIRVYTIHPPHFYAALRKWNEEHPSKPIWLIHGVWTEPPPGEMEQKYDDPQWLKQFHTEMQRVVSLLHGDANLRVSPGHASGHYTSDVSPWTLGYIIGREWEPYSVVAYNKSRPGKTAFRGHYITLFKGSPLEAWLAEQCDYITQFEMTRYNTQRPVAYTNWPTLDPLTHPTETTKAEELALLLGRGEKIVEAPKEYDNDAVGLDAVRMKATAAFPAGVFASYHAYPYYPEFMIVDPGYSAARSPEGPSNYFGYLRDLIEHHGDMPVIISEYGVPSSRGLAHVQPQGFNHGGLSEKQQGVINARLTRDIYASGAAGAGIFAMIDEWFKKNWAVVEFELPADRKRLWLNVLDAEEGYGFVAMRAGSIASQIKIDGSPSDWVGRPVLYTAPDADSHPPNPLKLRSLSVAQDEAFVYLLLQVGQIDWKRAHYQIGVDTYRASLGDTRLPNTGSISPVGLEFVIEIGGPMDTQVRVDHPYNLYRPVPIPGSRPLAIQYVLNTPLRTVRNSLGQWDSLTVVTNRRRVGRNGRIYPSISYNRNRLLYAAQSENSLADWFADKSKGVIELRIPWGMFQVLDPSSRNVLQGDALRKQVAGATTDGFRFVVESFDPTNPQVSADALPRSSQNRKFGDPPTWTWSTWEAPKWHAEIKPMLDEMARAFSRIPDHPKPR